MTAHVKLQLTDLMAHVSIDDGKANALNPDLMGALDAALDRAAAENLALLISGRPMCFSGGLDLRILPKLPEMDLQNALAQFFRLALRIFTWPRPVVAACTGHALAGGAVLLLAADERLGQKGPFKLGLNETALGIALPRFVLEMAEASLAACNLHKLLVRGEILSPDSAKSAGLLHEVVSSDVLIELATSRLSELARLPREAYAANKLSLRKERAQRGQLAFEREGENFAMQIRALVRNGEPRP